MKNLFKILSLVILFVFLTLIPGCGCAQEEQKKDEKPVNVLDPDFKGPTTPPFSNGPTEPPPSL
jgi:hypothetical protein